MKFSIFVLIFLLISCAKDQSSKKITKAGIDTYSPAAYTLQDGEGYFHLTSRNQDSVKFEFKILGKDQQKCQYSGSAKVDDFLASFSKNQCRIDFTQTGPKELLVEAECSEACSGDLTLNGVYSDIGDLCSIDFLNDAYKDFQSKIQAEQFQNALDKMDTLVSKCTTPFSRNRVFRAKIRNEMAQASLKLNNKAKCMDYLNAIEKSQDLEPSSYSSYWTDESLKEIEVVTKSVNENRISCNK